MTAYLHELSDFKTLQEFKDTSHDAKLTLLQDKVYKRIEGYLGRFLDKTERTEEIRIKGAKIPLKAIPVDTSEDITVIKIDDFSDEETTYTLTATEYEVTEYGLLLATEMSKGQKIQVTYTGGYSKSSSNVLIFPDDDPATILEEASMMQLTHEWNRRLKPEAETITTDLGTIKVSPLELLPEVKAMLNKCRHPRMWWFM